MTDFRMQAVGGMAGAWDMWEMQMIPKLLANCGSWVGSQQQHYNTLDDLQNLYCRLVYSCPDSTPLCSLRAEAGLLGSKHRIWTEKVVLVSKIIHQNDEEDDNYAKEVLMEQYTNGWGGLTEEVVEICRTVGLGNACEVFLTRAEVKEAMLYHHLGGLKEELKAKKKLDRISNADFRKMKSYMLKKSLADSRLEFKWRTSMLDCRACIPAKYGGGEGLPAPY